MFIDGQYMLYKRMGTEPEVGVSKRTTFTQELSKLKREGSNILLVGESGSVAHESACQRHLGDATRANRYRLFVTTADNRCCELDHVATDRSAPRTRYIVQRSGEVHTERDVFPPESVTQTTMLGVLGTTVVETIDEFEDEAGGLDPSELRVCVDSLDSLLDDHQSETVFRLVHVLTTRIRQSNGMGHFHLPVDRDHDAAHLFEPLFDAIVEVRTGDRGPEHRWHLRDQGTSSDWVSL